MLSVKKFVSGSLLLLHVVKGYREGKVFFHDIRSEVLFMQLKQVSMYISKYLYSKIVIYECARCVVKKERIEKNYIIRNWQDSSPRLR